MTQERSCGTCTKCCDGWLEVQVYGQRVGSGCPCKFVQLAEGCQIYGNRPQMCQEFKCAWLEDQAVPDHMKPEVAGVIAYSDPNRVYLILKGAGSAVTEEYQAWAKMYAKQHELHYIEVK